MTIWCHSQRIYNQISRTTSHSQEAFNFSHWPCIATIVAPPGSDCCHYAYRRAKAKQCILDAAKQISHTWIRRRGAILTAEVRACGAWMVLNLKQWTIHTEPHLWILRQSNHGWHCYGICLCLCAQVSSWNQCLVSHNPPWLPHYLSSTVLWFQLQLLPKVSKLLNFWELSMDWTCFTNELSAIL